jgi:hypothetical protein
MFSVHNQQHAHIRKADFLIPAVPGDMVFPNVYLIHYCLFEVPKDS